MRSGRDWFFGSELEEKMVFVLLVVVEIWDHLDAKWSKSGIA